jgi:hypothetical protein
MSSPRQYEAPDQPAIADRLNGLVSEIWATEQDGSIRGDKRRRLEEAMDEIEAALEDDPSSLEDSDVDTTAPEHSSPPPPPPPKPPGVSEQDLEMVRNSLASTVESMHMRQQEQRHLQQLTVEKLEAIAQRCVQQEKRLREFAEEMVRLKRENTQLRQENETLDRQLDQAQVEATKKEVAVNAMSSAVIGLEGWINASPTPSRTPRRVVTRGRGRFRGRYYVDETREEPVASPSDGLTDARALHEGVTAWLRGFRDVEEELRASDHAKFSRGKKAEHIREDVEEDWGDFASAPET